MQLKTGFSSVSLARRKGLMISSVDGDWENRQSYTRVDFLVDLKFSMGLPLSQASVQRPTEVHSQPDCHHI